MPTKRSLAGLCAALTMGAALLTTGTAQATPAPHGTSHGHIMTMPAAPKTARPAALLTAAPSTSPAVRTAYAGAGGGVYCQSGYFCASV